jgi:hypothetical protein
MALRNAVLVCSLTLLSFSVWAQTMVAPARPFEPWVKTAKVGDFIVIQYHAGTTYKSNNSERKTVKSIEDDCIVVVHSDAAGGKGWEERFSRDESTAVASNEVDMTKSKSGSIKVGAQTVQYEVFDGFKKGLTSTLNGVESFKALKYQKTVAQGVPLGGVIKVLHAPDDGKSIQSGRGQKTGAIKNTNEKLELYYEVTDFGTGK